MARRRAEGSARAVASATRTRGLRLAAATLTGWGIHGEQIARGAIGLRDRAPRPGVHPPAGGCGDPLVLINGIGVSGLVWPERWVRELRRTHRVLPVDNRGTGRSRWSAPFTISDLADDVVAVLDAEDIASAAVLGFSMGGIVAQELAVRHPGRVDRLALVSTIPPTPAHVPTTDYRSLLAPSLIRTLSGSRSRADVLARFYLGTSSQTFRPTSELVDELAEQLHTLPTVMGAVQQARAIAAWRHPERLAALAVPTTVVAGSDDRIVLPANGERLAELIPGARYVELPHVGHMVPWEAAETLIDLLKG